MLNVADVMQPLARLDGLPMVIDSAQTPRATWSPAGSRFGSPAPAGPLQDESLEQALRQLAPSGPTGLPVVSMDRRSVIGWVTNHDVVGASADRIAASDREVAQARLAAEFADL